jgi:hypothetical protein
MLAGSIFVKLYNLGKTLAFSDRQAQDPANGTGCRTNSSILAPEPLGVSL